MRRRVPKTWGDGPVGVHIPNLLIESDDPALAVSDFTAFEDAGFHPALCTGPDPSQPCPLVAGGRCELIDEADVVLHRMSRATPVPSVIARQRPDLPVVVVGAGPGADLPPTASVGAQAATLRRALYRAPGARSPARPI